MPQTLGGSYDRRGGFVSRVRLLVTVAAAILMAGPATKLSAQWTGGPTGPISYDGPVSIGSTNPGATLETVAAATTGTNYGIVSYAIGTGAAYNTAAYFDASGATTNSMGVRIVGPAAGAGNWALYSDATAPVYFAGSVGIGTANPQNPLSVNGIIQAKAVLVNTGWSDYVFAPGYQLLGLKETAAYIQENHHLPNIPSEAEVEEKGVSLGDMQAKLLAKIEEITLHMIQAEDRNDRLEQRNNQLDQQNRGLQERLARLEAHTAH